MEIDTPENIQKYWNGRLNYIIRLWMYCERGADLTSRWRTVFMLVFGLYWVINFSDDKTDIQKPWLLVTIFLTCIPILCVLGWVLTHKVNKVIDWLNVKFSTHYTMYQINMQERQTKALETLVEKK